jgi:endoglucanase
MARSIRNVFAKITALTALASLPLLPAYAQSNDSPPIFTKVPKVPIKRCANLGNMFEQPRDGKGWGGRMPVEQDFQEIAKVGFDTVRFPIRWSAYAAKKAPYTIEPDFFKKVDQVVGWALANNLNIIVDLHHYDEIYLDPKRHEDRLVGLWVQIADHYKQHSQKVMFEVLNEPTRKMTNAMLTPLYTRILAEIRKTNPTRKVIFGGDNWSGVPSLKTLDLPKDRNVIATFHSYEPFNFTHQGASWTDNPPPAPRTFGIDDDFAKFDEMAAGAIAFQQRTGIPVFLGEFGAINTAALADRARYTKMARETAEALGIGWCAWSYTNSFHIREGDRWIPEMLDALGLPPKVAPAAKP